MTCPKKGNFRAENVCDTERDSPLQKTAAEVGLELLLLCDFLEGTATLRSHVLDRLAQAVGATIHLEPTPPERRDQPA